MEDIYIRDKTFDKEDFKEARLQKGEYEGCTFKSCDFSNTDLSGMEFSECMFAGCNLSLVKLGKTALREVEFKDCKMLGLHFENCEKFGLWFRFENCNLDHSSFYQVPLKKTVFKNTQMHEVDFTEADLSASVFDHCDLMDAKFENTNLEKADFRSAFNYSIDPEMNRIKKTKFSIAGISGLLDKYDIEISS